MSDHARSSCNLIMPAGEPQQCMWMHVKSDGHSAWGICQVLTCVGKGHGQSSGYSRECHVGTSVPYGIMLVTGCGVFLVIRIHPDPRCVSPPPFSDHSNEWYQSTRLRCLCHCVDPYSGYALGAYVSALNSGERPCTFFVQSEYACW